MSTQTPSRDDIETNATKAKDPDATLRIDLDSISALLVPDFAACLDAIRHLDIRYPVKTKDELRNALFPEKSRTRFARKGLSITRERFDARVMDEFFPMSTPSELMVRAFILVSDEHEIARVNCGCDPAAQRAAALANSAVFCPANVWTKVVWGAAIAGEYKGEFGNKYTSINWRRYSSLPPFYTEGRHATAGSFGAIFGCEPYVDFWFMPGQDTTVAWSGSPAVCVPPFPKQ